MAIGWLLTQKHDLVLLLSQADNASEREADCVKRQKESPPVEVTTGGLE